MPFILLIRSHFESVVNMASFPRKCSRELVGWSGWSWKRNAYFLSSSSAPFPFSFLFLPCSSSFFNPTSFFFLAGGGIVTLWYSYFMEKEMTTHSSILAWRIPWTEEPGRLQSTGSQRVEYNWSDLAHTHACHWKFFVFSLEIAWFPDCVISVDLLLWSHPFFCFVQFSVSPIQQILYIRYNISHSSISIWLYFFLKML